jgi:hypothetical protein
MRRALADEASGRTRANQKEMPRHGGRGSFQTAKLGWMRDGLYLKRVALPEAGEGPVWVISGCACLVSGAAGQPQ